MTLLLSITIYTSICGAQIMTISGATFFVADSTVVLFGGHVNTTNGGIISNAGKLIIEGNFQNNGLTDGADTNTGIFEIMGDWINNSVFEADESAVKMENQITQFITGNSPTVFYYLELSNYKKIITQNTSSYLLEMNNVNLETGEHIFSVLNQSTNALVTYGGSFVSSTGDGYLKRATNSVGAYLFPVGSSYPVERKMFVTISPDDTAFNEYGVRFVNNSPDNGGYSIDKKSNMISSVNEQFYHHIYHPYGNTSADISFHINDETVIKEAVGHWEEDRWVVEPGTSFDTDPLLDKDVQDFTSKAFAFIELNSSLLIPNAFSPNGDGINDTFYVVHDDKQKFEKFQITIYNRWGEMVFESTDIDFHWLGGETHYPEPEVFIWKMKYTPYNTTPTENQGTITLIK